MLKDGRGVEEPDPLEALVWLGLAARIGHEGATRARTELETMTDPAVKDGIGVPASTEKP